jgi:DNA modification methylase
VPFEITENEWDIVIPPVPMFEQLNRVIKDNGAIILMSAGLCTAELILANSKYYRYTLIWKTKERRNFLNANRMPLRQHIEVPVFYKSLPVYNPQKTYGHKPVNKYKKHSSDGSNYGKTKINTEGGGQTDRYPTSIIDIPYKSIKKKERIHPTQKPAEVMEWIIKTFTNEGMTVLDFAAGGGTTAIACINTNRKFICFEKDAGIYKKAYNRVFNDSFQFKISV